MRSSLILKYGIYIILLSCSIKSVHAQENKEDSTVGASLFMKSWVAADGIYLRWGVDDKLAWKYGNSHGYIIERVTVMRDSVLLKKPERTILGGGPIKPKPMAEWESLVKQNDMAAVVAQAIYGEDFEMNSSSGNSVLQVFLESEELERRFGFSMFAMDQDFEAAQHGGMGYIDVSTKENEEYLYNIKAAAPIEEIKVKESGLYVKTSKLDVLPQPYDFAGYYYNNAFVLIWEYDALLPFYSTYDIEKSEDGINFSKINEIPIAKIQETQTSGISFTDSVQEYSKKFWYRIKGRSLFNQISQPSDTISVIAFKELLVTPEFKENVIVSPTEIILKWDFAKDESWKLKGFDVLRADKAIGPYMPIVENLKKEQRSYTYKEVKDINYFKIRARGIAGDFQDSSPNMVQPIDSIPPTQPKGLIGTIDTLGIVKLTWDKNPELDLKGYSLLRADTPNQEFTQVFKGEIFDNNYKDSINLKTFNKKVYYRVVARDQRYNESIPSEILVLTRPDMIPPTSPLFNGYEVKDGVVVLNWTTSSSEDVIKQILYRKRVDVSQDGVWENIYETGDKTISEYKDSSILPNTKYLYTLVALDNGNLESPPSPPLSIVSTGKMIQPAIKGLYAQVDRENRFIQLSWRYNEPNILELQLYRKAGEQKYGLYKTLSMDTKQFLDSDLIPNTIYFYGIKAVFKDGNVSEWTELEVKY